MATKKSVTESVQDALENVTVPNDHAEMPNLDGFERMTSKLWKPDPGEWIMGTYEKSTLLPEEYNEFDSEVMVHFVNDSKTNELTSFVGGKIVDNAFVTFDPKPGDTVFAQFKGVTENRKGKAVNEWDVRFKRA